MIAGNAREQEQPVVDAATLAVCAERFQRDGYVVAALYSEAERAIFEPFAVEWVRSVLAAATDRPIAGLPLERYHEWGASARVAHEDALRAAHRATTPPSDVARAVLSAPLLALLAALPGSPTVPWDEGLGWLAFRLVRPGRGDGYPSSRKEWGPAPAVTSCWIPVIGRTSMETLALAPGSQTREFTTVRETGKFDPREARLAEPLPASAFVRPDLAPGEAIVFGPRVIHTEETLPTSSVTRLSLEVRFAPRARGT